MPNNIDERAVTVSVRIYERLLATYPAVFRREYGPAMKQLFRDQCRDAWSESGGRGLAVLWLRVLPDLAKTSFVEHLSTCNPRETIFMKMIRALRADPRLRATFMRAFAIVFIGAIVCSVLMAWWLPRTYSSTVRLEVQREFAYGPTNADPYFLTTQFKIIESYSFLTNVIDKLRLTERLPDQLGQPAWTMDETYQHLSKQIEVKQTRMTSLLEVTVKNSSPQLAANIANSIADSYRNSRLKDWRDLHLGAVNLIRTNSVQREELRIWAERALFAKIDYLEYSNILFCIDQIPRDKLGSELPDAYRNLVDSELREKAERLTVAKRRMSAVEREYGAESAKYKTASQKLEHLQQGYDIKVDGIVSDVRNRVEEDRRYLQIIDQSLNKITADQKDRVFREVYNELKDAMDKVEQTPAAFGVVRDPARPERKPVNGGPSIFLMWLLAGTLLALVVGGTAAGLAVMARRFSQPPSAPS